MAARWLVAALTGRRRWSAPYVFTAVSPEEKHFR
jgi:hypothetical protein